MIVRVMVRPLSPNLGPFGDHHDAPFADVPTFAVFFEVVSNLRVRRHFDVLVDDRATDLGVPADDDIFEEHGLFDVTEGIHATAIGQDAAVDAATRDDATVRNETFGRDADASAPFFAEDEFRGRVVTHAGADGPALIVEIEGGLDGDEVHLRGPVGIDGADVAPVRAAFVFARDAVCLEVVDMSAFRFGDHHRDDVASKVVRALFVGRVLFERCE